MEGWIVAIIKNDKGEKEFHQFENEEELRFFLANNESYELIRTEKITD